MPELPEVETIRLGLQKYIVGKTIEDVDVRLPKILQGDPKNIIGAKVKDIKRFGKGLVIDLSNNFSLAIHLKLTGQLIYEGKETKKIVQSVKVGGKLPNKRTHVVFKLSKGSFLYYNDLRQFGWIRIVQSSKLKMQSFFKDLGPEPLKDLTLEKFREIVNKTKLAIKVLLMDQKRIGGVGNIYANEALFDAGIDPRRSAKQITHEEAKRLYISLLKVLKKGLEKNGASDVDFVSILGEEGKYQNYFLAYAQDGKPCSRCKTLIKKIILGGRGTYFCPACQR